MGKVAELECIACGNRPVQVHHIREGQGMSQKASPYLTIPMCISCHTDSGFSTHGANRRQFHNVYGSELDMLAETIGKLNS